MCNWRRFQGSPCLYLWLAFVMAACAADTKKEGSVADAGRDDAADDAGDSGETALLDSRGQASVVDPSCSPPPDCAPLETPYANFGVCCSDTLRCGFDFSFVEAGLEGLDVELEAIGLDPGLPCLPRSSIYFEDPTERAEERVPTPDGGDLLITPECAGLAVLNTPFVGCCLPNDECGLSTHLAASTLAILGEDPAQPFASAECVSSQELGQQFASSSLAAFSDVPETTGRCDHAALDDRLVP